MTEDFDNSAPDEEDFVESIAPDVLRVLRGKSFFKKLESSVFPTGVIDHKTCDGTYARCQKILTDSGFSEDDQIDVIAVMRSMGGFCDCEIVLNVDEDSKVRAEYWRGQWRSKQSDPEL